MFLVARIDSFRAVADVEILVEFQPGTLLQKRHAKLFRRAGIDGRFIDDHIAGLQNLADGLAGSAERRQHRAIAFADRCRHGHDIEVAVGEIFGVGGKTELVGRSQFFIRDLERRVGASLQFRHTRCFDIKADDRVFAAELHRQRQADIAKADHADADFVDIKRHLLSSLELNGLRYHSLRAFSRHGHASQSA